VGCFSLYRLFFPRKSVDLIELDEFQPIRPWRETCELSLPHDLESAPNRWKKLFHLVADHLRCYKVSQKHLFQLVHNFCCIRLRVVTNNDTKMRLSTVSTFLGLASAVSAHFQMQYPDPRGPFVEDNEPSFCGS